MTDFRFVTPRPAEGLVTVTRFWEHRFGGTVSATEQYGPDGLVGPAAPIVGREVSEQEADQLNRIRRQEIDQADAADEANVRTFLAGRADRQAKKRAALAEALGVDVEMLEGLI